MDMKAKRRWLPVLLLCLSLALCGCRARTSIPGAALETADETTQGETASDAAREDAAAETENGGETGGDTKENPDASRKEYDESAPAEIVPGADHLLHEEGEGTGAQEISAEAQRRVNRLDDRAEETAVQTAAADEAEQRGVSEDAEAADSALDYFTVLLQDRMGSLFECQRLNVYWETARDHVTVHKTSLEHALIANAGLYDVSARLLAENLLVDDGWVARKNPGVIVKVVDSGVLGSGVGGIGDARAAYRQLVNRDGWAAVDAVKNGRVLLLSEELLGAPHLQAAAMVMIAKTANPSLFSDVRLDEMLNMLAEEATGTIPTGRYYYVEE